MTKQPKKVALLSALAPPSGQSLRSAILTTFDLDLDYLERVVLPTLAGVETTGVDRELDPRARGEIMLELRTRLRDSHVAVLADKNRFDFSAAKGLETYELLFAGSFPRFHPKISILAFDKDFRIIVSSANLTEPGYHTNLELLWMASTEFGDRFGQIGRDSLEFIDSIARREWPASQAIREIIADLRARMPKSRGGMRLLHSERHAPILKQWIEVTGEELEPDEIHIISPFFDKGGELSVLREFGSPPVHLYLTESGSESGPEYRLPLSRKTLSRIKPECEVISSPWMLDFIPGAGTGDKKKTEKKSRILHAKLYVMRKGKRAWALLGSPNFTHRALLAPRPMRNAEAAVALSGLWKEIRRLLPPISLKLDWKDITSVAGEDDQHTSAWVPFLDSAEYDAANKKLLLAFSDRRPLGQWSVSYCEQVLESGGGDREFPSTRKVDFALRDAASLAVREGTWEAMFPIGVIGKEMLPEFPGMEDLDYEDILEFLAHGVVNMRHFLAHSRTQQIKRADLRRRVSAMDTLSLFIRAMENLKARMSGYLATANEARALFDGDLGLNRIICGVVSDEQLNPALRHLFLLEFLALLSSLKWKGSADGRRTAAKQAFKSARRLKRHLAKSESDFGASAVALQKIRKLYLAYGSQGWQRP